MILSIYLSTLRSQPDTHLSLAEMQIISPGKRLAIVWQSFLKSSGTQSRMLAEKIIRIINYFRLGNVTSLQRRNGPTKAWKVKPVAVGVVVVVVAVFIADATRSDEIVVSESKTRRL